MLSGYEDHIFASTEWRTLRLDPKIVKAYGIEAAIERSPDRDKKFTHNMILDDGRKNVGRKLLNFASPITYTHMAVGSSIADPAPTQTTLTTELTGNATRKPLTNTAGNPWTNADFVSETPPETNFRFYIIAQGLFPETDGNNGSLFAEYGVANQAAFGAGTKLYNRWVEEFPFTKNPTQVVASQMLLRL